MERASSPSLFDLDEDSEGGSEDFGDDAVERDERRLADLGRRTVEMYALSHLFTVKIEVAFAEAQAIKMQEALIAEEEEAERVAAEIDGAKKSKKAKQKQRKKEKKEAEEAEAAARLAEEEAAKAAVRAAEEAKRAEERRRREAELALIAEAEAREQAEQAAAAAAAAAVKAAEAAARAAEQARIDAEREAAERAAKEAELSPPPPTTPRWPAPGSNETDSEEAVTPPTSHRPSTSASSFGAYDSPGRVAGEEEHPDPEAARVRRAVTRGPRLAPGDAPAPGRGARGSKKGKSRRRRQGAPQPSPKKQLPSPRTGGGDAPSGTANGGRADASSAGAARSPEVARTMQGDGPLGAVEAAGLRAHAQQLESENARLRRDLARALGQLEVGGQAAGVAAGTPPQSPARGGEDPAKVPNGSVVAGIAKAGSAAAAAGTSPPPGPRPPARRARAPAAPGPRPIAAADGAGARPLPPPAPPRGPPPPGTTRLGDRGRGSPGRMADRAGVEPRPRAVLVVGEPRAPAGDAPAAPPGAPPVGSRAPPPPPGMPPPVPAGPPPPGMQTPPNAKMGAPPGWHQSHMQSPGVEDDFMHLGMISDLLDDSPGGLF